MLILGLTGGIAMGKSHVTRLLRSCGVPVHDSDAAVHALYAPGGAAVAPVLAAFPGTGGPAGGIDRGLLRARVLDDLPALHRLERIVHRLVRGEQRAFLARSCRAARPLVVLDVPLLLETGGERRVDRVLVVSAPPAAQAARALRRPGMTRARLAIILRQQMSDAEKRRRADFVIAAGRDRGATMAQVAAVLSAVRDATGSAWPQRWLVP